MLDSKYNIPPTEFEVHSDCYQYMKSVLPLVRGEIKVSFSRPKDENGKILRDGRGKKVRAQRGARFDLVAYDNKNKAIFIVEVKRNEERRNTKKDHYERTGGVPCYTVGSLDQCKKLISQMI